jgi:hypothetical protein
VHIEEHGYVESNHSPKNASFQAYVNWQSNLVLTTVATTGIPKLSLKSIGQRQKKFILTDRVAR